MYVKHKPRLGRLWSSFSPLSAQLSCQPVTYFGLLMKYRHSFATILPLNHFVDHEISQLFVTILVQNTELSRLNHGKYSVGYICSCYDVKSIVLARSIRMLYNLEYFYLRRETATITAKY